MGIAGYVWIAGVPARDGIDGFGSPTSRQALVAADVLNVREAPGTDAAILDRYVAGDSVQVVGDPESGFVPVVFGDGRAWMAEEYLSYGGSTRAPAANPIPVQDVAAAEPPAEPEIAEPEPVQPVAAPVEQMPILDSAPDPAAPAERWIDIDRSEASVTLYERSVAIATFTGRIGRDPSADGFYATAVGTYHVYSLNKGLAPTPFAEDTWLTDWVGFDPDRGNGIHSPVRDADGVEKAWQNPTTLGCVRLDADAAVTVFDFAEIGMRVEVHD